MKGGDKMDIMARMRAVVADKLSVDEADVVAEASFKADLGADSLDLVELVMGLEEEFDISIPEADMASIVTVQDAINYINGRQA
jgi:acyl carrier protein